MRIGCHRGFYPKLDIIKTRPELSPPPPPLLYLRGLISRVFVPEFFRGIG